MKTKDDVCFAIKKTSEGGAIVIILEDVTIIVPIVHCHIKVCNMKVHSGYFEEKKVQKIQVFF